MARPSRDTDIELIRAAVELIPKTGISGLTLRLVAEHAGVNLGMFKYNFKNKDEFIEKVMQTLYDEFFKNFQLSVSKKNTSVEQLREAIFSLATFARDNRGMTIALVKDIIENNQLMIKFLEKNVRRHLKVIVRLILKSKKDQYIGKYPLSTILPVLMGSMAAPIGIAALLERTKLNFSYRILKKAIVPKLISNKSIHERINIALKGLEP